MYVELATKLSMEIDNVTTEWSQPVSMGDYNAVQFEATVFRRTATDVTITLQVSNDNENWRTVSGASETISAEGYVLGSKWTAIGSSYVRLKYEITGSATEIVILAVGLHFSRQD